MRKYPSIPPLSKGADKVFLDAQRAYIFDLEQRLISIEKHKCNCTYKVPDKHLTPTFLTVTADTALGEYDMWQTVVVLATSDVTLTLPTSTHGMWVTFIHGGATGVVSISNGTNVIAQIDPGGVTNIHASSSSGTATWASGAIQVATGGTALSKQALLIDNANAGVILKDSSGDYWRVTIDTAGALTSTNLGSDRTTSSGYETE